MFRNPGGTTVTLNEYACEMDGIVHVVLAWIGKVRLACPARLGGPNAPVNPWPVRVSTTRQGVIPTNTSELADEAWSDGVPASGCGAPAWASACVGCQY